jgi:hypothetical protein
MEQETYNKFKTFMNNLLDEIDTKKTHLQLRDEYLKGYTLVYNLLTMREGYSYQAKMYEFYKNMIKDYSLIIYNKLKTIDEANLETEFNLEYNKYFSFSNHIIRIMKRLEDYYISNHNKELLLNISKNLFKQNVFTKINLDAHQNESILKMIQDMNNFKGENIPNVNFVIEI